MPVANSAVKFTDALFNALFTDALFDALFDALERLRPDTDNSAKVREAQGSDDDARAKRHR